MYDFPFGSTPALSPFIPVETPTPLFEILIFSGPDLKLFLILIPMNDNRIKEKLTNCLQINAKYETFKTHPVSIKAKHRK
jgi:hypothetical protein